MFIKFIMQTNTQNMLVIKLAIVSPRRPHSTYIYMHWKDTPI